MRIKSRIDGSIVAKRMPGGGVLAARTKDARQEGGRGHFAYPARVVFEIGKPLGARWGKSFTHGRSRGAADGVTGRQGALGETIECIGERIGRQRRIAAAAEPLGGCELLVVHV